MSRAAPTRPGDELIPAANMTYDRRSAIDAAPQEIWPWLVQLGKHRAGWYLPARIERLIPPSRRAARTVLPQYQTVTPGDRIPDYGGRDEYLEVAIIEPPNVLVYRSQRRGAQFTWALLLTEQTPSQTELRLRFRGQITSTGLKRRVIVTGGDFFDWSTAELMVHGLRERLSGEPVTDTTMGTTRPHQQPGRWVRGQNTVRVNALALSAFAKQRQRGDRTRVRPRSRCRRSGDGACRRSGRR
jgi:hypothetical protein